MIQIAASSHGVSNSLGNDPLIPLGDFFFIKQGEQISFGSRKERMDRVDENSMYFSFTGFSPCIWYHKNNGNYAFDLTVYYMTPKHGLNIVQ